MKDYDMSAAEMAANSASVEQWKRAAESYARTSPAGFCQLVLRDEMTGRKIENTPMHKEWHNLVTNNDRLVLWAGVDLGKHLHVTTLVPTPSGWCTMGDISPGDDVYGRDGKPYVVSFVTPVEVREDSYRLIFDDGSDIVASGEHRWLVQTPKDIESRTLSAAHAGDGDPCACGCGLRAKKGKRFVHNHHGRVPRDADGWRVATTAEMLAAGLRRVSGAKRKDGTKYDIYKWRIPITAPVDYPARDYPVHPYVLGVWLGNGGRGTSKITLHGDDRAVGDRCVELEGGRRGSWTSDVEKGINRTNLILAPRVGHGDSTGLVARLTALGIIEDKHIPEQYLLGSIAQRRDLLAGLLDTDGYGGSDSIEFTSTDEPLARGVLELARSLGFKASIGEGRATLNGRDMGPKWRVTFTAHEEVFWSPRKRAMHNVVAMPALGARTTYRCVVSIEPVPSVPMRCITVESPDHTYLAGREYVVTHNTAQLSIGRTLWELGVNQNLRCVIVTKTANLAQKITRSIAQYITKSEPLHGVFPKLRRHPDVKLPWNMTQLTVARSVTAKDASVQATGIFGNIHGGRIDWLVLDDVLDSENTRTKTPREHLWNWVRATLMGRLTAAARVLVLGNAWHPEDLMHRLEKEPGYVGQRFPVITPTGEVSWPSKWPDVRIEKARSDMGPLEFSRALLCQARADEDARFKQEWIEACCQRGVGLRCLRTQDELYDEILEAHPEWVDVQLNAQSARLLGDETVKGPLDSIGFYTGVDLAFSKKDSADMTCIFTIAVFPNGDRRVLEIDAGRWMAPETITRIESAQRRYGSIVMVENVAGQRMMIDMLRDRSAIPVVPFSTSSTNRLEFAVESLAVEMMNKKWIIPSGHEGKQRDRSVDLWLSDLYSYDPVSHLSDRTAAACFARACANQHAANSGGSVSVKTIFVKKS